MKFTIALILCFASATVFAISKDDEYRTEMYKLYKKYSDNAKDDAYKLALYECGNKGNYYCSVRLADMLFVEKEYKSSFDHYTKCVGECEGHCDFHLGYLYRTGLGVLQNNTKALEYYKKAAKAGVPEAAYNIGVYYSEKMLHTQQSSDEGQKRFDDYARRNYAWLKVAMAMGLSEYDSDEGTKKPAEALLIEKRHILISHALMGSADKLAVEICSGIKACKQ